MSLTRKDYVMLAQVIAARKLNAKLSAPFGYNERELQIMQNVLDDMAEFLSADLKRDNKAFDRERFLKDCGVM